MINNKSSRKIGSGLKQVGRCPEPHATRPKVSMQMTGQITLDCTSPVKRFPSKTLSEKKFFSTQSLTVILTKNESDYHMAPEKTFLFSPSFNIAYQRVQTCYHSFRCFNMGKSKLTNFFWKNILNRISIIIYWFH